MISLLFVSVAWAQVGPNDFGGIPVNLFPPKPVVVTVDHDLPGDPWTFDDGSVIRREDLRLTDARGPVSRFFASGRLTPDPVDTGSRWEVTMVPRGFRGHRRLREWVQTTFVPWTQP